jgi:hypothetical protein
LLAAVKLVAATLLPVVALAFGFAEDATKYADDGRDTFYADLRPRRLARVPRGGRSGAREPLRQADGVRSASASHASSSPVRFIAALVKAYRASGRTAPLFTSGRGTATRTRTPIPSRRGNSGRS